MSELGYSLESAVFDSIIREANYESDRDESIANCVNRQEFIEFCVLLARFLFTTMLDIDNDKEPGQAYYGVSIPKAVELLITQSCQPFLEYRNVEWQSFRDLKLWTPDVKLIYTMNETALRNMYSKFAKKERSILNKVGASEYLSIEDCEKIFKKDKHE